MPAMVPMIHVPDVLAALQWYEGIGFTTVRTHEDAGEVNWALLLFGTSKLMLSTGGRPTTEARREVDLFLYVENLDDVYAALRDRVDVQEKPHETFYGMREFTVRDVNGFWVTFTQASRRE